MISIRTVLSELINLELRTLKCIRQHQGQMNIQEVMYITWFIFYNKYSNSRGPTQRKNDIPSAQDYKSFVKQMLGVHGFVVLYFVAVLYSVYSIDPLLMHLSYVFLASTHRHDVIKWRHFPRYWPFVRGIQRSLIIPITKTSDAELWCFHWSLMFSWRLNKELSKKSRRRWYETPSRSLWRYCNQSDVYVASPSWYVLLQTVTLWTICIYNSWEPKALVITMTS